MNPREMNMSTRKDDLAAACFCAFAAVFASLLLWPVPALAQQASLESQSSEYNVYKEIELVKAEIESLENKIPWIRERIKSLKFERGRYAEGSPDYERINNQCREIASKELVVAQDALAFSVKLLEYFIAARDADKAGRSLPPPPVKTNRAADPIVGRWVWFNGWTVTINEENKLVVFDSKDASKTLAKGVWVPTGDKEYRLTWLEHPDYPLKENKCDPKKIVIVTQYKDMLTLDENEGVLNGYNNCGVGDKENPRKFGWGRVDLEVEVQ